MLRLPLSLFTQKIILRSLSSLSMSPPLLIIPFLHLILRFFSKLDIPLSSVEILMPITPHGAAPLKIVKADHLVTLCSTLELTSFFQIPPPDMEPSLPPP
ncbi:hypothetical protein AVEN_206734-1 [Araneus ventricosus]|uniref:Uncharacterized protein n=1 Tax=Araneus ventricosus TaxID=182803 RepID=A0A4Y2WPH8_ARAVE|nr:hypothetical protein AVEN_206734-1 [Araneus ventricosus]